MEEIKAVEPICPIFFNTKLMKKVEEQKKEKKSVVTEQKKTFEDYLKEALGNK